MKHRVSKDYFLFMFHFISVITLISKIFWIFFVLHQIQNKGMAQYPSEYAIGLLPTKQHVKFSTFNSGSHLSTTMCGRKVGR